MLYMYMCIISPHFGIAVNIPSTHLHIKQLEYRKVKGRMDQQQQVRVVTLYHVSCIMVLVFIRHQ